MKKIFFLLLGISIFYISIANVISKTIEIPDNAIRVRIIPNSNSNYDQRIKNKVKEKLRLTMYDLLKNTKNSEEAKKLIINNLDSVDNEVKTVLEKENYNKKYDVKFGYNYFPEKKYKGIKYNEGYYESLLITLGEGKGDNWWCVLFPPLCLIEAKEDSDVEYKIFVKEIIEKYLK